VQYAVVLAVVSTLFVSALAAATPAPSSATSECPAPAQIAASLNALVPGVAPEARPGAPLALAGGLRLVIASSADGGGDVRIDLYDAQGAVALHRVLPGPPRGRAPDCPALAETVALIVDRYLHDVGYEVPPLPPPAAPPLPAPVAGPPQVERAPVAPPPPPAPAAPSAIWRVGLAASGRLGDAGGLDGDADLAVGLESGGDGHRWGGRLSFGYAPAAEARWSDKTGTLHRLPARFGVFLSLPAGPGRLEPGLGGGVDVLLVSAQGPGTTGGVGSHLSPFGDLAFSYLIPLTQRLYTRALSRVALSVPYVFKDLAGQSVWGTPRVYGEAGVELGLAFQ
jgi:hypothetical protein